MFQIEDCRIIYKKDLRVLADGFSLTVHPGDKIALIGEEGNGKSTLLKWMYDPALVEDYAEVHGKRLAGRERLGYLPQELSAEDKEKPVYAYMTEERLFTEMNPAEIAELGRKCGLDPEVFYDERRLGSFSGGEKIKIETARILASMPTVFLLDEPSNDLDIATLEWMEKLIRDTKAGVVYISHDEVLLENTANRIVHMELFKRKTESRITVMNVSYAEYVKRREDLFDRQMMMARSDRREEKIRMEKFRRIQQKVEHDLRSVSRQDPHGGFLLKKKMRSVKSMEKRFERERENITDVPEKEEAILFHFENSQPVPEGKTVLDFRLDELRTPGEERVLAKNIELFVRGPRKVCIIGKNGSGKTTLLKKIREELKDRKDLRAAYMPQNYEDLLEMEETPVEYLAPERTTEKITKVRKCLGAMKYTTDEMDHAIRELSGGQKAKVFLLKMVLDEADVLLLDEPTRNFSPLSAPVIREVLKEFPGAIIAVSHDRRFLAEVPDQIYELTKEGLKKKEGAL